MKASVIICTYSMDLLQDTIESVHSVLSQDYPDKEVLLVMDRNEELYGALSTALPSSVQIVINEVPGLSEARNTGIKHATGDIIVFIDDDAVAAPGHLSNLMRDYADENVIGVGGKANPRGKPSYPEELYWIGGYTYKGHPEERCAVRNMIGCNMSFRREVFDEVGLFDTSFGRVGRKLVTAEETEFCLRVATEIPNRIIIYEPDAVVFHKIHQYRQNLKYGIFRGYYEGRSKARIKRKMPKVDSINIEKDYIMYLMFWSVRNRLKLIDKENNLFMVLGEITWIIIVATSVGLGYFCGQISSN